MLSAHFDSLDSTIIHEAESFNIRLISFSEKRVSVIITDGLSNIEMPVHNKYKGQEHVELYFCLPSYWDVKSDDEKFQWPVEWLKKITNYVLKGDVWIGPGDTFENTNGEPFSSTMKSNHLLLGPPQLMNDVLAPKTIENKTVHFLGITPIFGDEMDFKQAKGTYKLLKKLGHNNVTEKLDDFRETVLKSRMKFF